MVPHGSLQFSDERAVTIYVFLRVHNVIANVALHGVGSDLNIVKRGEKDLQEGRMKDTRDALILNPQHR